MNKTIPLIGLLLFIAFNGPVRFEKDLKITIQDLGWHLGGRYLAQRSDISSTCFWYQSDPHASFPKIPEWRELEVN